MENNTPKSSGLAIAGLVLGIIAAVTSFLPIINNFSAILAFIGFVLALIALIGAIRGKHTSKGISIAGVVLCVVSFVVVLASQAMYKSALDSAAQSLKSGSEPVASTSTDNESKASDDAITVDNTSSAKDDSTQKTEEAQKAEKAPKADYSNMAIGETVTLDNGLSITVNSVEGGAQKYDGSPLTKASITYANNGSSSESFNIFDWKSEDANGVETSFYYYSQDENLLDSGKLKPGGTVTGNVYFEGDPVRIVYYSNMFQSDSSIGWAVS